MQSTLIKSLAMATMGAGFVACNQEKQSAPQRPNIIFIMSDDHAYQALSAYGHGLNKTPNIDRIAREGAIFNAACVTNSICAPSRATMLTGKYNHLNGKIDNINEFDWNQPNFAKNMQAAGYQTALIGKIHLDGAPQGFHYWNVLPGQGEYYNPDFIEMGERKRFQGYCTELTTEFALDWLENKREQDKPFLLLYHQKAPHRNWQPSPQYLNLFDDKTFDPPANFFDDYQGRGRAAREQEMEIDGHAQWGWDFKLLVTPDGDSTGYHRTLARMDDHQRGLWMDAYEQENQDFLAARLSGKELALWKFNRYIKDYLRTIQSVDDGVGEILDYLDKNGLADNTIIVYTSDQGFYLGEHGWFDKRFMYEQSLRTPLVVRYPKEIKPGTVIDDIVVNIDFAPTFLDYAGIETPSDIQGESFRKLVAGEKVPWRDAMLYHYYEFPGEHGVKRHYGVRTNRYKLIHFYYDIDEWEMYDLEADPDEMNSVYNDPAYAEVQEQLHQRLRELREQYGDTDELTQFYLQSALERQKRR